MKKFALLFTFTAAAAIFPAFLFCEDLSSVAPEIQFVKGNMADKIAAVQRSPDSALAKNAIDFVIENAALLKNDRELVGLAVAGVLSYPVGDYKAHKKDVLDKFSAIFYGLDDETVRLSIMDKVSALYAEENFTDLTAFVNGFLLDRTARGGSADSCTKKAVETLGRIGNGSSFGVLYSIIRQQLWPDVHPAVQASLVQIADKSLNEIVAAISEAELVELKLLFQIYVKNEQISLTLRSEIAEKMLNRSMLLSGDSSQTSDLAHFQLDAARVLYENKWTRASELGKKYFGTAKAQWQGKFLTDEEFTRVIRYVEVLSSRNAVQPFSDFMSESNKAQEAGNAPDKTVVLALINALGSLGDKSAFDVLLYVTYLNYPEDVTAAARNALSGLKW